MLNKRFCIAIYTDMHTGIKRYALAFHLRQPAVDMMLLHLEIWDAVSKETANTVVLLENVYCVASASELLCTCKTGWPGACDSDSFT